MRRTIFLAAMLFAAPAQAASLPAASEPGISAASQGGGRYLVSFTSEAYKPIAGHQVEIVCTSPKSRTSAAGPPQRSVTRLTLSVRTSKVRLKPPAGDTVCAFAIGGHAQFVVALTTGARRFLADYVAANGVEQLVTVAAAKGNVHGAWPSYASLPKTVRSKVAHLSSPAAMPKGKAFGYWSDGKRRMTAVGVSATGDRLSFSIDGEDATTNIAEPLNILAEPSAPRGTLPAGPFPPAGTPLPDATVNGVTATQDGHTIAVSFSGTDAEAAYGQMAGHQVVATCTRAQTPKLGLALQSATATFTVTVPQQPTTLRFNLGTGLYSTCSLGVATGAPVVQVAVGSGGRAPLADGLTSEALQIVARRAAGSGSGGYASSQSVATAFSDAVVGLAAPTDTPADQRVGLYSDTQTRMGVVARSLTGRRLYAYWSGDTLKTNLLSVTELIPFS